MERRNSSASLTVCLATAGPPLLFIAINNLGDKRTCPVKYKLECKETNKSQTNKNGTSLPSWLTTENIYTETIHEGTKVQRDIDHIKM